MLSLLTMALAASSATAAVLPRAAGDVMCPIVFDGRVANDMELSDFDSYATSPFNPDYVKGNDIAWSDILILPGGDATNFDGDDNQPFEVTLSDESVFMEQYGFRRAGLLFQGDDADAPEGNAGVKTIHFSVKIDAAKAMNLSHEYLLVWHEAADYSANQFNFEMGSVIGQESSLPMDTFKLLNRQYKQIWDTPVDVDAWNNFAITIDYNEDTLQVYYSKDDAELEEASRAISNDNSGEGQFQVGLLKKPTDSSDVVNEGFQSSGLDEGIIYGGVFVEDGADGCISL